MPRRIRKPKPGLPKKRDSTLWARRRRFDGVRAGPGRTREKGRVSSPALGRLRSNLFRMQENKPEQRARREELKKWLAAMDDRMEGKRKPLKAHHMRAAFKRAIRMLFGGKYEKWRPQRSEVPFWRRHGLEAAMKRRDRKPAGRKKLDPNHAGARMAHLRTNLV